MLLSCDFFPLWHTISLLCGFLVLFLSTNSLLCLDIQTDRGSDERTSLYSVDIMQQSLKAMHTAALICLWPYYLCGADKLLPQCLCITKDKLFWLSLPDRALYCFFFVYLFWFSPDCLCFAGWRISVKWNIPKKRIWWYISTG